VPLYQEALRQAGRPAEEQDRARRGLAFAFLWSGQFAEAVPALEAQAERAPNDQDVRKALEEARAGLQASGGGSTPGGRPTARHPGSGRWTRPRPSAGDPSTHPAASSRSPGTRPPRDAGRCRHRRGAGRCRARRQQGGGGSLRSCHRPRPRQAPRDRPRICRPARLFRRARQGGARLSRGLEPHGPLGRGTSAHQPGALLRAAVEQPVEPRHRGLDAASAREPAGWRSPQGPLGCARRRGARRGGQEPQRRCRQLLPPGRGHRSQPPAGIAPRMGRPARLFGPAAPGRAPLSRGPAPRGSVASGAIAPAPRPRLRAPVEQRIQGGDPGLRRPGSREPPRRGIAQGLCRCACGRCP
jgi:hypothetical protein